MYLSFKNIEVETNNSFGILIKKPFLQKILNCSQVTVQLSYEKRLQEHRFHHKNILGSFSALKIEKEIVGTKW